MELTEEQYEKLMLLANADGKEELTKADFDIANSKDFKNNTPSKFGLLNREDTTHKTYYMGVQDKNGPNMLQIYDE